MTETTLNQEARRWTQRPPGSNWGDFGPDDQCGRLNLLTPEKVRQGVAEVREGLVFCLSLPLDYPGGNVLNPRRHPPVLRPTVRNGRPNLNYRLFTDNALQTDVISDDLAVLHLQYSTQWDSLAHVGQMFDADGDGTARAGLLQRLSRRPGRGRARAPPATPACRRWATRAPLPARGSWASRTWPSAACRVAA